MRTARGLIKRHVPAASPVARPASALARNPTAELPGTRARSLTPLPRDHWYYRLQRVLLVATPDHCGPPGPVASPVAVLQQTWLRSSATAPPCELHLPVLRVLLPGSSSLPGLAVLLATTETIATPRPNVYLGQHRFSGCVSERYSTANHAETRMASSRSRRPGGRRPRSRGRPGGGAGVRGPARRTSPRPSRAGTSSSCRSRSG